MQAAAAGSATGNKHISHTHSTPVTAQMAALEGRAHGAMKKDEQSGRHWKAKTKKVRVEELYFSWGDCYSK